MDSKIAGQLKPDQHGSGLYESEPLEIPYFNNKKLAIGFAEAEHKEYMDMADIILQNFLELNSRNKIIDSAMVHEYYAQTLKHGDIKPLKITSIEDIWDFVEPEEIIIQCDENANFYLCVSCSCEWEQEHGLQLVFKNGQTLTRASGHDGHFTD
jgi:hypothetical protein